MARNKVYPLVANKYKGKRMLAPMYFLGDQTTKKALKRSGYTDIKVERKRR